MEQQLVSVIIPIFKIKETFLRQCIVSVLEQSYQTLEILLIDDGSQDQSGGICDFYATQDERIRVFHTENQGVSSARNTGIENARGTYFLFLDGDDWLERKAVERAVAVREKYDCQLVGWNNYYNYEPDFDKNVPRKGISEDALVYSREQIRNRLMYDMITPEHDIRRNGVDLGEIRVVWGKLYDADIIRGQQLRFDPELKIGEDACFNIAYLHYARSAVFIKDYMNHYRMTADSANHRYRADIVEARLRLLQKYLALFPEKGNIFKTCFVREILSCVLNILLKNYSNPENRQSFREKCCELSQILNERDIRFAAEWADVSRDFLSKKESIMLRLVIQKRVGLLILFGKAIYRIKK